MLIGGTIPWLFSSLTVNSVARAAGLIVEEVRRQFRIPGLLEGKVKPDYGQTVGLCTTAAQRELIPLAADRRALPAHRGAAARRRSPRRVPRRRHPFRPAPGRLHGQLAAEHGTTRRRPSRTACYGGKGSEAHKAAVIGDTVGDPLKDTSGPALNPMIKVINLVSLLAAPLLVGITFNAWVGIAGALCVVVIMGAVWYSKRGGFGKKAATEGNFQPRRGDRLVLRSAFQSPARLSDARAGVFLPRCDTVCAGNPDSRRLRWESRHPLPHSARR